MTNKEKKTKISNRERERRIFESEKRRMQDVKIERLRRLAAELHVELNG